MNAAQITEALGGTWHGHYGTARCPAHEDRNPSLSISSNDRGKLLVKCHAGCDQHEVWIALDQKGLICRERDDAPPPPSMGRSAERRQAGALRLWREARAAVDSPVAKYLQWRGIKLPPPPTLRYHPGARYDGSGILLPCMIAAVQAPDRKVCAVHRTWIRDDGRGKAGVATPKKALGPLGGGAVRLGPACGAIGLAEGIETALSAMELFNIVVWAACGSRLDRVELPEIVTEVQIFSDAGPPGFEAARKAAARFRSEGRRVAIRVPPEPFGDFNDVLQAGALAA